MSTFINQTIARQQVAELIAQAEAGRVRRQFRQARRANRAATRRQRGPSNTSLYAPNRIGLAGVS